MSYEAYEVRGNGCHAHEVLRDCANAIRWEPTGEDTLLYQRQQFLARVIGIVSSMTENLAFKSAGDGDVDENAWRGQCETLMREVSSNRA